MKRSATLVSSTASQRLHAFSISSRGGTKGWFGSWPEATEPTKVLEVYAAQLLMAAGDRSVCGPRQYGGGGKGCRQGGASISAREGGKEKQRATVYFSRANNMSLR